MIFLTFLLFEILPFIFGFSLSAFFLYKHYIKVKREEIEIKHKIDTYFQNENKRLAINPLEGQLNIENHFQRQLDIENYINKKQKRLDSYKIEKENRRLITERVTKERRGGYDNSSFGDKEHFFSLMDLIVEASEKDSPKFIKQEIVNDKVIDPITGKVLDIVICSCKQISDKDSYAAYGCSNCKNKIVNKK